MRAFQTFLNLVLQEALDVIRKEVENCDCPQGAAGGNRRGRASAISQASRSATPSAGAPGAVFHQTARRCKVEPPPTYRPAPAWAPCSC